MKEARGSFTASSSPYVVDLRALSYEVLPGDVQSIASFDVEVVDNAAAVTVKGTGPFTDSDPFDVTDGTFAIAGGKRKIENFALATLTFTSAATPFNINIVRKID